MKKFNLILIASILLSLICKAQSQNDTSLYLLFTEGEKTYKVDLTDTVKFPLPDSLEYKRENVEFFYYFNYYLYDGYPLEFESINRKNAKKVSPKQLKKYPVVTPEQLKNFIAKHYDKTREDIPRYYGSPYFNNLKHIYIVEKDKTKGTATITEVKLDVQIE